jgi:WD40 repeat protein
MKTFSCLLLLMLMIGILPASAQDEQCVELRYSNVIHQVNLDTGEITTFDRTAASATDETNLAAPYIVNVTPTNAYDYASTVTLTDTESGISLVIAPVIAGNSVLWSPDHTWIAFAELNIATDPPIIALTLYQIQTGVRLSIPIEEALIPSLSIHWSPDGRYVDVTARTGTLEMQLWLYSVPDMNLILTRRFEYSDTRPSALWSPTSAYLLVRGLNMGDLEFINMESGESVTTNTNLITMLTGVWWSPDGAFLATTNYRSSSYSRLYVTNMQGELLIDNLTVNRSDYQDARWLSDGRLLAQTDEVPEDDRPGGTDSAFNLTILDFQTGEQTTLVEAVSRYRISSDRRFIAATSSDDRNIAHIIDLTSEMSPITIDTEDWIIDVYLRTDPLELLTITLDGNLQSYDPTTGEWRLIATVSGEWQWDDRSQLRLANCAH